MPQRDDKAEATRVFGLPLNRTWQFYAIILITHIVAISGLLLWQKFVPAAVKPQTIIVGYVIGILATTFFATLLVRKAFELRKRNGHQIFIALMILSAMIFGVDFLMVITLIKLVT